MKYLSKWTIAVMGAAMGAAFLAGNAASDTLLTFKVASSAEKSKTSIVCVGDARDPAKFGGMVTDQNGMAGTLIPVTTESGDYVHQVVVTAYNESGSTRKTVDLAARHVEKGDKRFNIKNSAPDDAVDLKLSPEGQFNCGEVRPISTNELAERYGRAMRSVKGDVMQELEEQGSEVTPALLDKFINQTIESIARYDGTEVIQPTGKRKALQEVFEQIARAQRKREQSEKLKEFIEDFAAAARAWADERDAAREAARIERELEEAREKVEAEAEERRAKLEVCYGAMGPGCGVWGGELGITLCGPSTLKSIVDGRYQLSCAINSGSWKHDECCTRDENGHWCFGPGPATQNCKGDFDRGFARMLSPFQWERHDVDPARTNGTGKVEHNLYCAKPGTPMWKSEVDYCCSKKGKDFNFWEGAAFTVRHGAWAFAIPKAQVCAR